MTLKIGFIAPTSQFIPKLSQSLLFAFELGLDLQANTEISIIKQAGGFNASARLLKEKIEQIILEHDVDLIVTPVNTAILEQISESIDSYQVPLIALTLGEDVSGYDFSSPYIWINSYQQWHSMWLLGQQCAQMGYKAPFSVAAYHDSGYAASFAFSLGLESLNSGIYQFLVEAQANKGISNWDTLDKTAIDAAFVSITGKNKDALFESSTQLNLPIFANTVSGYNDQLSTHQVPVFSCSSWDTNSNTPSNLSFIEQCKQRYKRQPNAYELLAYETGLLLKSLHQDSNDNTEINNTLAMLQASGPRGLLTFEDQQIKIDTFYMTRTESGQLKSCTTLKTNDLLKKHCKQAQKQDKNGWLNPYLIA